MKIYQLNFLSFLLDISLGCVGVIVSGLGEILKSLQPAALLVIAGGAMFVHHNDKKRAILKGRFCLQLLLLDNLSFSFEVI